MKKALKTQEKALLEVMHKPLTQSEIKILLELPKATNMSSRMKRLANLGLVCCLKPKKRLGQLFGLTKKGITTRRKLGFKDYYQPHDIDWNLYGWVVSGSQRRAMLKAMSENMPMSSRLIRERANEYNSRISRTNANDILHGFVKQRLSYKAKQDNKVYFRLTKVGQKIKEQLKSKSFNKAEMPVFEK